MESLVRQGGRRFARNALAALLLAAPLLAVSLRGQAPGASTDPARLAARDEHQGLLIAADPYLTTERSEEKFGKKHPFKAGILAVDVYLRNDTGSPIQVSLPPIELNVSPPGGSRQKIESLTSQEAAVLIIHPQPSSPTTRRVPIPGAAGGSIKGEKEVVKMQAALAPQMLGDIVGPHGSIHGFLFFDVNHHFDWVANSTLYFPEVRRVNPEERLLFFEVDLGPAAK
jgi:hypothetical protein